MGTLLQDFRYGLRMLLKHRGFTAVAMLTLALGIGANSAIFSVVNGVLLQPLPLREPSRLVMLWENNLQRGKGWERLTVSPMNFADWGVQANSFDQLAGFRDWGFTLTGRDEPEQVQGALVSASFFKLFAAEPVLGRTFAAEEDQPGRNQIVVLSHDLWQRRFGADAGIVGQNITLNSKSFIVVGVLPASFNLSFVRHADLWAPLSFDPDQQRPRFVHNLWVFGRLRREITLGQAQAEMETIAHRLELQYPESNTGFGVTVMSLQQWIVGEVRPTLLLLFGAIGLVLLIACANVANLLLMRATMRQKEMAVRAALGASRGRLVRQLLTESLVLFLAGGILGLLVAAWAKDLLLRVGPSSIPRLREITVDGRVIGFTLGLSLLTGILFGLAPAIQISRTNLQGSLKESGQTPAGTVARGLLVIIEVSLAVVLLVGAGLLSKTFLTLQRVDLGFEADNLLTVRVSPAIRNYPDRRQVTALYGELLERIGALPGVKSVGATSSLPLSGMNESLGFEISGRPAINIDEHLTANYREVSSGYFKTLGAPLVQGRFFTERDTEGAPGVIIINDTMARRFFANQNPLGQRLSWRGSDAFEIVGVVGDIKHDGPGAPAEVEMYRPLMQSPRWFTFLVVRTANDSVNLNGVVRNNARSIDPDLPLYDLKTMQQRLDGLLARPRFNTLLLNIFAAVALILAAVGIYGVVSYSIGQRTREIGIRMALGAQTGDVLRLTFRQSLGPILIGLAIGLTGALALARIIKNMLFEVSPTDPTILATVALLLVAVALLATYIPARRAMKVDPVVALHCE